MAKTKTAFVCNNCGAEFNKWQGQCSACGAWNSVQEIRLGTQPAAGRAVGYAGSASQVQVLKDISLVDLPRFSSGMQEFDRVLGSGFVPGSVVLIGGNPGAGKSTLLLQTLCHLAQEAPALYVTGEESLQQVAMRAQRLSLPNDR
ncbi:MAG TPA: ATPase domain-containing protein, partial [Marinagarivorans sp.]|nr:ATPase domain-containing protein [Marinagarivorans sp.]